MARLVYRFLNLLVVLSLLMISSNTPVLAQEWQALGDNIFVRDLSSGERRYYLTQAINNEFFSFREVSTVLNAYGLEVNDIQDMTITTGKMVIVKNKHKGGVLVGEIQKNNVKIKFIYAWNSEKKPQIGLAVQQVSSNRIRVLDLESDILRDQEFAPDLINYCYSPETAIPSEPVSTILAKRSSKCSGCLEACNFLGGLHCTITAAVLCAMVCGSTVGLGCPVGCAIAFYLVCYAGLRNCNYLCNIGGACP